MSISLNTVPDRLKVLDLYMLKRGPQVSGWGHEIGRIGHDMMHR